jgi:hypothetical protein
MVREMDKQQIEASYWNFFNKSARVVGGLLCGAGMLIGLYNIMLMLFPGINVSGSTGVDSFDKWISVVFPIIIGVLGFLVTKSDPYFPPHIERYERKKKEVS